jgi:hypothetical protein
MEITPRLIAVLKFLRRVKCLSRKIVQQEFFPADKDGAVSDDAG